MCLDFFMLLVVMSNAMYSSDDDMSVAGLTQENPEYKPLTQSSDEDDGISNLHALFESARKLAGGEIKDFGDAVFNLSQVDKPSDMTLSAISVGTEDFSNVPKLLTYSDTDQERNFEVCLVFLI